MIGHLDGDDWTFDKSKIVCYVNPHKRCNGEKNQYNGVWSLCGTSIVTRH